MTLQEFLNSEVKNPKLGYPDVLLEEGEYILGDKWEDGSQEVTLPHEKEDFDTNYILFDGEDRLRLNENFAPQLESVFVIKKLRENGKGNI